MVTMCRKVLRGIGALFTTIGVSAIVTVLALGERVILPPDLLRVISAQAQVVIAACLVCDNLNV